jgi:hypothetical protein
VTTNRQVTDALANLRRIVECVCDGVEHETHCRSEYLEDVEILEDTLRQVGVLRDRVHYGAENLEVMYYISPTDTVIDNESGVMIKHLPTGVYASCHRHRRRIENQVEALAEINNKLAAMGWVDRP